MKDTDRHFFQNNRISLCEKLPDSSVLIINSQTPTIRSGDVFYPFCQNKNLYYLTGCNQQDLTLVIVKQHHEAKTYLFGLEIPAKTAHWFGHRPTLDQIKSDTGISWVFSKNELYAFLYRHLHSSEYCFTDYSPPLSEIALTPDHQFTNHLRNQFPHLKFLHVGSIMNEMRVIKQRWEIEKIEHAIDITFQGIKSVINHAKSGMKEYQLEGYFNFELQMHNTFPAFPSIFASGKNATVLHYIDNNCEVQSDDLILLDLGAEFSHYSADISRTFPINGTFSKQQKEIYQIVLNANKNLISSTKPGMTIDHLNKICRTEMAHELLRLNYIQDKNDISNHLTHSVTHQLGLDTHDVLDKNSNRLKPGMVITIEPGLYFEALGLGVRIEDDILITEKGCRNLSEKIPKEIEDIEALT